MNKPTKTLSARLADEAAEAARKAAEAAKVPDYAEQIAKAWDATGYTGPQPWHMTGKGGIYGDKASLSFRDVGPDELVSLMTLFPVVPRIQYSHSNVRYWHPVGGRTVPDGVEVSEFDGFEIEISGGRGYENFKAHWSAMVGDVQTSFRVDLRRVHYLHPRSNRRAVIYQGEFVRYEGRAELVWPKEFTVSNDISPVSYSCGDQSSGDFRIRGRDVLGLARAWEAEANKRGEQTKAAFLTAYAAAEAIGLPTAEDVAAQVYLIRESYAKQNLRAGTIEQTAALQTPHAEADKAVAEKHWPAYAAHHGIETRQGYFDHYSWACAFLKRCGLYEFPMGDKVYKYGAAWL